MDITHDNLCAKIISDIFLYTEKDLHLTSVIFGYRDKMDIRSFIDDIFSFYQGKIKVEVNIQRDRILIGDKILIKFFLYSKKIPFEVITSNICGFHVDTAYIDEELYYQSKKESIAFIKSQIRGIKGLGGKLNIIKQ